MNRNIVAVWLMLSTLAVTGTQAIGSAGAEEEGPIDAKLFVQAFQIEQIKREFPIKAGMTLEMLEKAKNENDRLPFSDDVYNLGWEKRGLKDGDGWIYFWVNGKHLLHCDVVIEDNRVKSVWVMPGNAEWAANVYCRISGEGPHVGSGRWRVIGGDAVYRLTRLLDSKGSNRAEIETLEEATTEKEAIPALAQLCEHADHEIRQAALLALSGMAAPKEQLPILLNRLDDEDWRVRETAVKALAILGSEAAPACEKIADLAFSDDFWLLSVPFALRKMGSKGRPAIPILIKAIQHEQARVRENALMGLGAMGKLSSPALPAIINAAQDENEDIRWQAVEALRAIGLENEKVVSVLVEALHDRGKEGAIRYSAAHTLASMKPPPVEALPHFRVLIRSADRMLRQYSAIAFGNTGAASPGAILALVDLLSDDDDYTRVAAAEALGKLGRHAKLAVPALKLNTKVDWTRPYFETAIESILDATSSEPRDEKR